MGNRRRVKKHTHRGMGKRLRTGKKPMSKDQKETRKKESEAQRERTKKDLASKTKK